MVRLPAILLLFVALLAAACSESNPVAPPPDPTPTPVTQTFTNATAINVPGGLPVITSGVASPYPATISVTGVVGTVTDLNVSLNAITHTFPDDIDVLIVGPQGQTVLLMSDTGSNDDVGGVTLTFDQSAGGLLPDNDQLVSGSFRPTNFGEGDSFPGAAPPGPYNQTLEVFNTTNPNGTWRLFVVDDRLGDSGVIGAGYTLTITSRE